METKENLASMLRLLLGLRNMPAGRGRIALAFAYGALCHSVFGIAVLAMIVAMYFGMSASFGQVPDPWRIPVNALLLLQFPLAHSVLLSPWGRKILTRMAPKPHGGTLSTTTYALIASVQLLALFALWTPSGVIWWQAQGVVLYGLIALYASAWLLLMKASIDAGAEVQSGALGWMSLAQRVKPVFPDMPTRGLFRLMRQPIYVSFALTLWLVPVWTPDQLAVALVLTGYCVFAPILKERRFRQQYGARFREYQARVPYMWPRFRSD